MCCKSQEQKELERVQKLNEKSRAKRKEREDRIAKRHGWDKDKPGKKGSW